MQPMFRTRFAALLVAILLADCAQNPVTGNPNLVLLSESQEVEIGKREDAHSRKQYRLHDDAPLQQYASGIGQRLATSSHLRVINGLYPAGEPVAGQPLKIVE